MTCRWGVSAYEKKGEDAFVADGQCFGVFDGHGGSSSAAATARELTCALHSAVLGNEAAVAAGTDESLVSAFYDVDASVGPKFLRQGTTATCALVEWSESSASVVLAWVGDSVAIEVDMETSKLVFQSSLHHVSNSTEMRRIDAQIKLRDDGNADRPEEFRFVLSRCKEYEARLNALSSYTDMYKRRDTTVTPREIQSQKGPIVLQSWLEGKQGQVVRGASTQVTRSIGDWDSSRALLPHPDILRREYAGGWKRFVLASDGLWDVVSPLKSTKIVASVVDPRAAADALLLAAKKAYLKKGSSGFKDDTTIIVFDVKLCSSAIEEQIVLAPKRRRRLPTLLKDFLGCWKSKEKSTAEEKWRSEDKSGELRKETNVKRRHYWGRSRLTSRSVGRNVLPEDVMVTPKS